MALDSAKSYRRHVMAFKLETTTGTEEALTGAEANIDAIEPTLGFDDEGTKREGVGLSSRTRVPGAQSGPVEFKCHLTGSGTSSVPALAQVLSCCGLKLTTNVLSPLTDSDDGATGTFGLYRHGRFQSRYGVMLDATFKGERGKPVEISLSGKGKRGIGSVIGPRDVSLVTPVHVAVAPPVLKGATFTIGSETYLLPGFELALGNDVQMREDITDATDFHAAHIPTHERRLTISPEALPLSAQDWFDAYESATEFAWAATIGTANGNNVSFAAPKLQLAMPPEDEDGNGIYRDKLVFQLNQEGADGDDELTITFDLGS